MSYPDIAQPIERQRSRWGLIVLALGVFCTAGLFLVPRFLGAESVEAGFLRAARNYDVATGQQPVLDHAAVDSAFARIPSVSPLDRMDDPFFLGLAQAGHREVLAHRYWVVRAEHLPIFLLGRLRVRDFVGFSLDVRPLLASPEAEAYFLLDPKLIHLALDLCHVLQQRGYDLAAIRINSCYRPPAHNRRVGGAKYSRHMHGQAMDLHIGDLNGDGKANKADKQIVLDILEKELMKGKGGIGKYPGTQAVHMDTRPGCARWDSYKVSQ